MPRARPAVQRSVTSVSSGTPTEITAIPEVQTPARYVSKQTVRLLKIILSNNQAAGNSTQVFVGIKLRGSSTWEGNIFSPILDGGEHDEMDVDGIDLNPGDAVEAYSLNGSAADWIDCTLITKDGQ